MSGRVAVLCTERWPESIDGSECGSTQLSLQLSADGEAGLRAKEVLGVVHLTRFGHPVEVERRHLEHISCSLAVAGGHQRGVEVVESVVVEVLMDGNGHVMADAEHCPEGVGAQAQMGILAHILEALSLFLHGIVGRTESIDFDFLALYLTSLPLALALHERTDHAKASPCGDTLERFGIHLGGIDHHLDVVDGRTIIESDEIDRLTAAVRAHPTSHIDVFSQLGALECIGHSCSFHLLILLEDCCF